MTDLPIWRAAKFGGKSVVASIRTYCGSPPFLDLREHFPDKVTGEPRPSGKGATVPLEHLEELCAALEPWRNGSMPDGLPTGE